MSKSRGHRHSIPSLKRLMSSCQAAPHSHHSSRLNVEQIGELALAWSEGREPAFDFEPHGVLSKDPGEWNERYYAVGGDNPFISEERLRQARARVHAYIARLFRDVWAQEKRGFGFWYDFERLGYQGNLSNAVMKSRKDRLETVRSYYSGSTEASLEHLERECCPHLPRAY